MFLILSKLLNLAYFTAVNPTHYFIRTHCSIDITFRAVLILPITKGRYLSFNTVHNFRINVGINLNNYKMLRLIIAL